MSARAVTMLLGGATWREVCDSSTHRTRSCVRHWQSIRQTKYATPRWPLSSADSLSDSSMHIFDNTYPLLVVAVRPPNILHILHIPCAYLYFTFYSYYLFYLLQFIFYILCYFFYCVYLYFYFLYNLCFIFCVIFSIIYICILYFVVVCMLHYLVCVACSTQVWGGS